MLAANITIKNIDYEKTMTGVFPVLKEKLEQKESEHMTIRLFQKLDDAALLIALDIMNRLPKETKNKLMVQILNTYSSLVRDKLNEKLSEHHIGKNLHVGDVSIVERDGLLSLWISQVKVDYKNLDYKNLVKEKIPSKLEILGDLAGKFGSRAGSLAGEMLEQPALNKLWKEENKQKFLALARDALNKYGIVMELDDMDLIKDTSKVVTESIKVENHLQLTDEIEEQILEALAECLKDTVKRNDVNILKDASIETSPYPLKNERQ